MKFKALSKAKYCCSAAFAIGMAGSTGAWAQAAPARHRRRATIFAEEQRDDLDAPA